MREWVSLAMEQINKREKALRDLQRYMSIIGHLEELRYRLIVSVSSFIVFAIVAYINVDYIRELFARHVENLVYMAPAEAFTTNIKLSLIFGFLMASPIIFYQAWSFVLPGLLPHERRIALALSLLSVFFFLLGVTFSFFVVLPFTIRFFLEFQNESLEAMFSFSNYISYSLGVVMGFGLVFEMPVAMMILASQGMISARFLSQQRRMAIVIIFVMAAIFTPPDVLSQVLMAGPLVLLYELSIILVRFVQPRESMIVE